MCVKKNILYVEDGMASEKETGNLVGGRKNLHLSFLALWHGMPMGQSPNNPSLLSDKQEQDINQNGGSTLRAVTPVPDLPSLTWRDNPLRRARATRAVTPGGARKNFGDSRSQWYLLPSCFCLCAHALSDIIRRRGAPLPSPALPVYL